MRIVLHFMPGILLSTHGATPHSTVLPQHASVDSLTT